MLEIPLAPCFRPTPEEFEDSLTYICSLVKKGVARDHGIIKIIPPEDFKLSMYHQLKCVTVTPRIQVLSELSLKNKSLLYSEEKKSLIENRNKLRKLNWNAIICQVCCKAGDDPRLLLCDGCDAAYHTYCLTPSLNSVPRGEWFCPQCRNAHMSGGHGFEHASASYSLEDFAARARHFKSSYFKSQENVPLEDVETEFWRLVACSPYDENNHVVVEYGADLSGVTAFLRQNAEPSDSSDRVEKCRYEMWNLNKLPVHHDSALRFIKGDISGMKSPWCYAGTCFSCFCWHVEDHWTYSINYNHYGEAKTWYGVAADDATNFEKSLRAEAPAFYDKFPTLMHNLNTMLNPLDAIRAGVRICKAYQLPGEFIITFPRAYHAGFNQGFNFAEAVNFCPPDWMQMGRKCIDSYRMVARNCVFSHSKLCITMAQRCEELSVPFLVVLLQEMDALLQQIHSESNSKVIAKMGFDLRKARVDKSAMRSKGNECKTCFKCNCMLYELGVSCICTKGKMSCIQHCATLCRCTVDNRRKRLYMSHSLNELNQLRDKIFNALAAYYAWRCEVRHLASVWRSAIVLDTNPNEESKPTLSEQSSFAYEDLCPNGQGDSSCLLSEPLPILDDAPVEDEAFEEPPPLLEAMEDLTTEDQLDNAPLEEHLSSDEELEALNDMMLDCFPFKQKELEFPVPDTVELMRKRTRVELVQLNHVGTLHFYPSSDRVVVADMLGSMDVIVRRVLYLLKPFTNTNAQMSTNALQEKVEIHDFMCLIHQMRMLPFDFENLQGPMEALCREVERVQHAVLELESRINLILNNNLEDLPVSDMIEEDNEHREGIYESLLNEIYSILISAEQLSVKINGLPALEEMIPILKWLDATSNYFQSAIFSPWKAHLVQKQIDSGHHLPFRHIVGQMLSILEKRFREGEDLAEAATVMLGASDMAKATLHSAILLADKASCLGITFDAVEELRATINRAQILQKTQQNMLELLENSYQSQKISLSYLEESIQAAEQVPLSFPESMEIIAKLKVGWQHIADIEQLFFSSSDQCINIRGMSLEEHQKYLLKVILPRSLHSIQHLQDLNGNLLESYTDVTSKREILGKLSDEDMMNVENFMANFSFTDMSSEQLLESYEEMSHLQKEAMLQLREKNKHKSDPVSNLNCEALQPPRYCFCYQSYDENKSMVECELCAEWYHDTCLQSFESSWTKTEGLSHQLKDEALIHNFLCPLCQRSLRPELKTVEETMSQWEITWPQSTVIGVACKAMLQQVKKYQEKLRSFMLEKSGPYLSRAWSECLKLFSSKYFSGRKALQQHNKEPLCPRNLRSQNVLNESKIEKVVTSDLSMKVFRAKDLSNVKSHCHQWLAQFISNPLRMNSPLSSLKSTEVTSLLNEMEIYVVEGNLLEISCIEAKALALIFQILQSDVFEKENAIEEDDCVAGKQNQMCENRGKRTNKTDRPHISKGKSRHIVTNSASQSHKRSAPPQEKIHLRSGVSPKKLRTAGRKKIFSTKATFSHAYGGATDEIRHVSSSESLSSSPGSVSDNNHHVSSRSRVISNTHEPCRTRQSKKCFKFEGSAFCLSTSSSDESEDECALGRSCVIHDKRNIRNVLWIQCDKCLCWYHYICVGLRAGTQISEEYICSTCSEAVTIFN